MKPIFYATNSTGDILEGEGSVCMEEGKRNQGLCMKYRGNSVYKVIFMGH